MLIFSGSDKLLEISVYLLIHVFFCTWPEIICTYGVYSMKWQRHHFLYFSSPINCVQKSPWAVLNSRICKQFKLMFAKILILKAGSKNATEYKMECNIFFVLFCLLHLSYFFSFRWFFFNSYQNRKFVFYHLHFFFFDFYHLKQKNACGAHNSIFLNFLHSLCDFL